jgi:DNA-binding response OmpR family regulator
MNTKLIYVVDDEQNIRDLIKSYLQKEGFDVETFSDGKTAYDNFKSRPADMLIIDIMMPGMDGYALCREVRNICDVPIIMVSAKDDEIDRVVGLELGSDDYISKPFSPRELVARVKNIFRRVKDEVQSLQNKRNEIKFRDLTILPDERRILKDNEDIELTTREYDFLFCLIKGKNRVFTREQLISSIWGYDYIKDGRTIDDMVKRVRKKLAKAGSKMEITTVWGFGYKISE